MIRFFLVLSLVIAVTGCGGVSVTPNPEPVAVTGIVTVSGKPVTDIAINFQPIDAGLPAVIAVKDGKFEAELTPGKYTYFVSRVSTPTGERSLAKIPVAYHQGAMDRLVDVDGAGPIALAMN